MKWRDKQKLRNPWLVAVWPGMGQVAAGAGSYLAHELQPEPAGAVPEHEFFSVNQVEVSDGIARTGALPRSLFFIWRDPKRRRDLVFFIGEAQPSRRGYALCHRILDFAKQHGVTRVVTFAAMGTKMLPTAKPRVFGAVTAPTLLEELRRQNVHLLREGRIGGLNGALLAAAAERGLDAMCLLGEMPFYAASVLNPASSLAVLEVFSRMSGVPVDLARLEQVAEESRQQLTDLWEQLKEKASDLLERNAGFFEGMELESEPQPEPEPEPEPPTVVDAGSRRRIEKLFGAAEHDRARAGELKQELDRLGVFDQYEDRFLDLFRKTG